MKCISKPLSLSLALILGACSHYSEDLAALDSKIIKSDEIYIAANPASLQDIAPAAGGTFMATNTNALNQYLARDYYELAKHENDVAFDYKAAKLFTAKATASSQGKSAAPLRVSSFDVPAASVAELNQARGRLMAALNHGNLGGSEASLAKAQTSFDCWLEQAEEASDPSHYASCKENFEAAMAQMIVPAAGNPGIVQANEAAPMNMVHEIAFVPASDVIDSAADQAIANAAAFLASPQGMGYVAVVTGYTVSETDLPSRAIATNRALRVRDMLMAKGIAPAAIKPQIAPAPQMTGMIPASTMANPLEQKVHIHMVAPAATQATTVTIEETVQ